VSSIVFAFTKNTNITTKIIDHKCRALISKQCTCEYLEELKCGEADHDDGTGEFDTQEPPSIHFGHMAMLAAIGKPVLWDMTSTWILLPPPAVRIVESLRENISSFKLKK